jgi:very-short-patch-repair endonuclease
VLGAVLADYAGPTLTEEGLEERFLALCRRIAYKADFLWRSQRLVVETDGRDVHSTRRAFDEDQLRDQRLALAGFTVVRFTWRQLVREPARVLRTTGDLLARLAQP